MAPESEQRGEYARSEQPPIAVVGTGLAGLSAALAFHALGVPVTLIGRRIDKQATAGDTRSTALFGPSLDFLARVGAMRELGAAAVPLVGLRLIDATQSLFRAPEVLFEAREIGIEVFGMNIENAPLLAALARCIDRSPLIRWHDATMLSVDAPSERLELELDDGRRLIARLVVGADGERSPCRKAAGIAERTWSYPQVAIATRFEHRRAHANVSTELHRRAGPMTTVPLGGNWSSLVWVEGAAEAERLMSLDDRAFAAAVAAEVGGVLGGVSSVGPRARFPLSGITADTLGARRVALVGEAGHRLPPIGAQGLNLGLRDVAWLAELVAEAVHGGGDPGADEVLQAYDRARRADVASRTAVVDALNRSLIADFLPADLARSTGLAALKGIGPLRRLFMREGMRPGGALPQLMQPVPHEDHPATA